MQESSGSGGGVWGVCGGGRSTVKEIGDFGNPDWVVCIEAFPVAIGFNLKPMM